MTTESFGTSNDLEVLRDLQRRHDKTCSFLDSDKSPWLPQVDRRRVQMSKLRILEKIRNRVKECVSKVTKYLVDNYQYIHASTFEVAQMVVRPTYETEDGSIRRGRGRLHPQTRRDLLMWRHGPFKAALQAKMELYDNSIFGESYTTKTCSRCGLLNDVGGSKACKCTRCDYQVHRDVNGARNHSLKNCVANYVWIELG